MLEMFRAVGEGDGCAYIVTSDLRLLCMNSVWDEFARANGGEAVLARWRRGRSIVDAISEPLRAFYVAGFRTACEREEPWEHDYECSTPDMLRTFRMTAYPFAGALVITNTLRLERPHDRHPCLPDDVYVTDGIVHMCAHCRRSRRDATTWDWVPAYLAQPPALVSHGLCGPCLHYHYPRLD